MPFSGTLASSFRNTPYDLEWEPQKQRAKEEHKTNEIIRFAQKLVAQIGKPWNREESQSFDGTLGPLRFAIIFLPSSVLGNDFYLSYDELSSTPWKFV